MRTCQQKQAWVYLGLSESVVPVSEVGPGRLGLVTFHQVPHEDVCDVIVGDHDVTIPSKVPDADPKESTRLLNSGLEM